MIKKKKSIIVWDEEEDIKIFKLFKVHGSAWSLISKEFPGKDENQIKNRFYSTLRRIATKEILDGNLHYKNSMCMPKTELLNYVDDALEYGHYCFSKRGKKKLMKSKKNAINQINSSVPLEFPSKEIKPEVNPSKICTKKCIYDTVANPVLYLIYSIYLKSYRYYFV